GRCCVEGGASLRRTAEGYGMAASPSAGRGAATDVARLAARSVPSGLISALLCSPAAGRGSVRAHEDDLNDETADEAGNEQAGVANDKVFHAIRLKAPGVNRR